MIMRQCRLAFLSAAIGLILIAPAVLYFAWLQAQDCAGAMMMVGPDANPDLTRALSAECASYDDFYEWSKWLSAVALVAAALLGWIGKRGAKLT